MAVTLNNKTKRTAPERSDAPAQRMAIPFPRASRMKKNLSFTVGPVALGAGAIPFGPIQVPANGYLRALNFDIEITANNNNAVVAFNNDAPYNVLQQLSVVTSSGDSLIVPVDGFALAMAIKWGAFGQETPYSDPAADPNALVTDGAVATGGSARFRLRIPFEIDAASGFCSLPNLAANRSYNVQGIFNSLSAIYATAPNGTGVTVTVTCTADYWSVPNDTNAQGDPQETAPVGNGSFHVLQVETIPVNAGSGIYQLHNVGNVIRQILFIYRDSNGERVVTESMPPVTEIILNNDQLFYFTRAEWQRDMAANGFPLPPSAGASDNFGGLGSNLGSNDNGVWPLTQFLAPGETVTRHDGPRNQYLPTLDATLLQVRGVPWGEAGTLQVLTSSIVPKSAQAMYAPHLW